MKVSAKLTVAFFCAALVINPVVLLVLFSQSTNNAISSVVSIWDAAALNAVEIGAESRIGSPLRNWAALVADDAAAVLAAFPNSTSAVSGAQIALGDLLQQYQVAMALSMAASDSAPDFHFAVVVSTASSLCPSNAFRVVAVEQQASRETVFSNRSNINATLRDALSSTLCLPNVSETNVSQSTIGRFTGAAFCSKLYSTFLTATSLADLKAGAAAAGIAAQIWATAPIVLGASNTSSWGKTDPLFFVIVVASPPTGGESIIKCPKIPPVTTSDISTFFVNQSQRDVLQTLTGGKYSIPISAAQLAENIIVSIGVNNSAVVQTTSLLLASRMVWQVRALTGGPIYSSLELNVPHPFAVVIVLWDPQGYSASGSRLEAISCDAYLASDAMVGSAADLCPSFLTYDISGATPSVVTTDNYQSTSYFFDLGGAYFLSLKPLLWDTLSNPTTQSPSFLVGLLVDTSTSKAALSTAMSRSVIIAVAFTAIVFVITLSVLHFIFHPLKVIGTLLRCCADIRLNSLETQSPSFIREIYELQRAVDRLIRRVQLIGKYIPDKSQLYATASSREAEALVDFMKTGSTNKLSNPLSKRERLLGTIAHSITVRVEYRSRRNPDQERDISDTQKISIFEFVYSAQDLVHEALLRQCSERLRERNGEALKMFDKHTAARGVPLSKCTPLFKDEDVLDAIEQSYNGSLNLIVMKASEKSYVAWGRAALFIIEFGCVVNAAVHISSASKSIVDSTEVATALSNTATALFATTLFRLAANTLATVYLVRTFAQSDPKFSSWVASAITETMIVTLLSSVSIVNITALFSNTRLTSSLRFNAPFADSFRHRIFRWSVWSFFYNEIIPLCLCANMLGELRTFDTAIFFGMLLPILVIFVFIAENFLEALILKIHKKFRKEDPGVAAVNSASRRSSHFSSMLEASFPVNREDSGSDNEDSATKEHDKQRNDEPIGVDAAVTKLAERPRKPSVTFVENDSAIEKPAPTSAAKANRSLYLGLSKRAVTILQISLMRAAAHFDMMGILEIQTFCSTFLSLIFTETRVHGGFILKVSNVTVTIGFNCHQLQTNHFERALGCYFSLIQLVQRNLLRWSEDDHETPSVTGAILSGSNYVIGFAGDGDAKTFQFLGRGKRELNIVSSVGHLYGASLTCNHAAAKIIENRSFSGGTGNNAKLSFTSEQVRSSFFSSRDTHSSPLLVRLIENVVENRAVHLTQFTQPIKGHRPQRQTNRKVAAGTVAEYTRVYEVVWDDDSEAMMNSSRTALAFLDRERTPPQAKIDGDDSEGSSRAKRSVEGGRETDLGSPSKAPVSPVALMVSHLSLYPNDTVARYILRRLLSNDGPHREYSSLGLDVSFSEISTADSAPAVPSTSSESLPSDDKTFRKVPVIPHASSVVSKICSSEKYVLYFTDL